MTLSRDVLRYGALQLSPAVAPSEDAISSSSGMVTEPSTALAAGTRTTKSDANEASIITTGDFAGEAHVVFDGPGPGYKWSVERASIGSVGVGGDVFDYCEVHAGDFSIDNPFLTLVDTTPVPAADVADESSPIFVNQGQKLLFRFVATVYTAGMVATARIQYVEEVLP